MDKEGMVHYLKGVIHPNNVFPKNKVTWVKVPEFEPLTLMDHAQRRAGEGCFQSTFACAGEWGRIGFLTESPAGKKSSKWVRTL
jgi:hypothetical protein